MGKGNNLIIKGVKSMSMRMPTVLNLFGVDPFDFGESNVANGFCNIGNELHNAMKSLERCCDGKYRSPNMRAERDDKLDTFYVELPGVKKEDIKVTVSGEYTLLLEAKRTVGKKETQFRAELASEKDIDNAKLTYADGLLTVTIEPKPKAEPEVKQLTIQ
jgi:HSP20 family molecular chaperone IbpA